MAEKPNDASDPWDDDLLSRKPYAARWGAYLCERGKEAPSGVVVALDASWGAGKSFFIDRWSKGLSTRHPVVKFDAWKSDRADDPVVAFVSELTVAVEAIRLAHNLESQLKEQVAVTAGRLVVSLRQAIRPTVVAVGKGLIKKSLEIDLDNLQQLIDEGQLTEKAKELTLEEAPKALAQLFEETVSTYRKRGKAIEVFQKQLSDLVDLLSQAQSLEAPLFIFIDELDRCRPDFAIRLLEGIKHIFGVRGVVFILAINATQLAQSVSAVYGTGFDGHSYLQRFFDLQLQLPLPAAKNHLQALKRAHPETAKLRVFHRPFVGESQSTIYDLSWVLIVEAFGLTLRQQEHVYASSSIAAELLTGEIHTFWLFYLAALKYSRPSNFARLVNGEVVQEDLKRVWAELVKHEYKMTIGDGQGTRQEATLFDVLAMYYVASSKNKKMAC